MRFVSLNLRAYFGRGGSQIQDLAELIALHRPDVVLLQEARPGWLGVVCSTAGLTGAYSLDVDPRLPGRRGDGCAIGVRSPLWIERTWRVAPGGFGPAVVSAVIDESVPAGYERLPGALAARFSTRTLLAVNLAGVYNTVLTAVPQIAARCGHIVLISSVYAFFNGVGNAPYAMAKAAVEQLGRALRVELVPHGAGVSIAYFGFIDTEMVHRGIDADPVAERLENTLPKVLQKRLSPAQAGEAVARGMEKRAPRITAPRRWAAFSALRGIVNPLLDAYMVRDEKTQAIVRALDARGDEEQPLTA